MKHCADKKTPLLKSVYGDPIFLKNLYYFLLNEIIILNLVM